MKVLFFNETDYLIFDATKEILIEVFDFGRAGSPNSDERIEDAVNLYSKFLEDSTYIEGDATQVSGAYVSFMQGISHADEEQAALMKNDFHKEDALIFGSTIKGDIASFFVETLGLDKFEEQAMLHKSIGATIAGTA